MLAAGRWRIVTAPTEIRSLRRPHRQKERQRWACIGRLLRKLRSINFIFPPVCHSSTSLQGLPLRLIGHFRSLVLLHLQLQYTKLCVDCRMFTNSITDHSQLADSIRWVLRCRLWAWVVKALGEACLDFTSRCLQTMVKEGYEYKGANNAFGSTNVIEHYS